MIQSVFSTKSLLASSSNFPRVTRRHNRYRHSTATKPDHSRSPKCGNRKTDNLTSSPAKSCSSGSGGRIGRAFCCLLAAVCFQNYFPVGNFECLEVGLTDPI